MSAPTAPAAVAAANFTLAELAKAQADSHIPAYDRTMPARKVARLQRLYAQRVAQLDLLYGLYEEGGIELTLRGESRQLTLRGDMLAGVIQALTEQFDRKLVELEQDIVKAHQDAEVFGGGWESLDIEEEKPGTVAAILALCLLSPTDNEQPAACPAMSAGATGTTLHKRAAALGAAALGAAA